MLTHGSIDYYYGLRYAAPPNGSARWQAPVDVDASGYYVKGQAYNASAHGPSCYQGYPAWIGVSTSTYAGQSEDCLLLDIVVPSKPKNNKLPVIVQIHGGGTEGHWADLEQ